MCGIAGFWSPPVDDTTAQAQLSAMARAIVHRGPDADGFWWASNDTATLGLAHRRLSIVDLSDAGQQPMVSRSGRWVLVYNGEIYNHLALRQQLQAPGPWRGHSDTETLLACIEAWGLEVTLTRCVGMFALALWDRQNATLHLARDRLGEKPLYYGWQGEGPNRTLLWGSELKALRAHPAFVPTLSRAALAQYFERGCIGAPLSVYRHVLKLPPGTWVSLGPAQAQSGEWPAPRPYWSALRAARDGLAQPLTGSPGQAVASLDALLREAVQGQMMADVPLGAFLSGGVDSSTVVALMQQVSSAPVRTYTIGFEDQAYDEATHAAAVARHLGTVHTELRVTPAAALDLIASLPQLYDEPFSDSSQIPTSLVCSLTRHHVTVALSGDGGDELFGGYNRHLLADGLWPRLQRWPSPLRQVAAQAMRQWPAHRWDALLVPLMRHLPARWQQAQPGAKMAKLAAVLGSRDGTALYRGLLAQWNTAELMAGPTEPQTEPPLTDYPGTLAEQMMLADLTGYLPSDILAKVDRAAMGCALETRVPFLDHRVVEFAWRIPLRWKLCRDPGQPPTKWLLRQVLYQYVPRKLVERPKMGFGVPLADWLRGPLRPWAEDLLSPARLQPQGILNASLVQRRWHEHLSGRASHEHALWTVLMFQAWLQHTHASTVTLDSGGVCG